jgi:hypothetical protein
MGRKLKKNKNSVIITKDLETKENPGTKEGFTSPHPALPATAQRRPDYS